MNKERYNQIIDDVYNNFLMISKKRVSKEMIEKFVKNTPKVEFINKIKTDERFSKYWGLKIEERELSDKERAKIYWNEKGIENPMLPALRKDIDNSNVPTRVITVTYYNETIKFYD
jgi:phosphotransacetylase